MVRTDRENGKKAKQTHVIDRLRRQIVTGELPPGSRLPTRRDLETSFGVSPMTIQQALGKLMRDGFVEARGKLGTFVVDRPPHLTNIALAFCSSPSDHNWTRFWAALVLEAASLAKEQNRAINVVYDINGHVDNEDYQKLIRDVRAQRLAGIVFTTNPYQVRDTPLFSEPNMAQVSVAPPNPEYPASPVVHLHTEGLIEKALSYFASRNRKKLAIVQNSFIASLSEDQLQASLDRWGMTNHPYWRIGLSLPSARWARNAVHMMTRGPAADRPDALLILDDNLVEYATFGLIDSGIRVPDDIDVIAHCNFPWPTPSVLPIRRLGYDARAVLRACIASIDAQRAGQPIEIVTQIPAQFEEEVRVASAAD